ncbi:hypothetical protein L873DRAFT_1794727 [Choiromyces venosus 120613-1]|uniref:Uncharacterized protein n=1 Tax=Choiromyces venosus 120613-1 TaxID=1336337 RepID=A0A3N4J3I9_9PEZI|nr:hypothetical protein L873DRAFT_1794727 [Choiromyces venosus 120613-1]
MLPAPRLSQCHFPAKAPAIQKTQKKTSKIVGDFSTMQPAHLTKWIGVLRKSGSLCDASTSASEPAISSSGFVGFIDLDDLRGDDLAETVPGPVTRQVNEGGIYITINYPGTNVDKVLGGEATSGGDSPVYQQLAIYKRQMKTTGPAGIII